MKKYRIITPASTSNLGPGFDCLGLAVSLYLRVQVEPDYPAGFQVTLSGEGQGILPDDERNWVLKSAREIAGPAVNRAAWHIDSQIPVARGLGSSAAARAAGLAAGYLLRDGTLPPRHEMYELAVRSENHRTTRRPPCSAASASEGATAPTTGTPVRVSSGWMSSGSCSSFRPSPC